MKIRLHLIILYAEQLVKMNNYYNSAEDPARFQDLISQLKGGLVTTITTASSQSESVNEAWKLLQQRNHGLKVYAHSTYTGRKLNYKYLFDEGGGMLIKDYYVDATLLFDLGIQYRYRQRLQLPLDCENLYNTDHYICGPNYQDAPHFKRGRSLMASVSYKF